ncbi:MAG: aspartate-semialdehyde dehydrogenase [Elusimicrobia bacterium]|nr:aspartate-semialdehyde dehydrogenase [Elusimicrobiota bacterium]
MMASKKSGNPHKALIGIIGPRGLIGQEFLSILERRRFSGDAVLVSTQPKGRGRVKFRGASRRVLGWEEFLSNPQPLDVLVCLAETPWSKRHLDKFFGCSGAIIDESNAFRMNPDVPLVIPEINGALIEKPPKLIASPNCTTVIAAMALAPILKQWSPRRLVIASYQAASGAGREALERFEKESKDFAAGKTIYSAKFSAVLAGNVIPQIGVLGGEGFTEEEGKVIAETRKIFDTADLPISATCVRVPVRRGHSVALWLELERPINEGLLPELYTQFEGVSLTPTYPMPAYCAGKEGVFVGRLRRDPVWPNGVSLWACGDNLIKGGAQNVWQIVDKVLSGGKNNGSI